MSGLEVKGRESMALVTKVLFVFAELTDLLLLMVSKPRRGIFAQLLSLGTTHHFLEPQSGLRFYKSETAAPRQIESYMALQRQKGDETR